MRSLVFLVVVFCGHQVSSFDCPGEWMRFRNTCYRIPLGQYTFRESFDVCRNLSGQLVEIKSEEEQDFIEDNFFRGIGRDLWTGLIRVSLGPGDHDFQWLSEAPVTFSKWATNQPNNRDGLEFCVTMSNGPKDIGHWHDVNCRNKHSVLCQRNMTCHVKKGSNIDNVIQSIYKQIERKSSRSASVYFKHFLYLLMGIFSMFLLMSIVYLMIMTFLHSTKTGNDVECRDSQCQKDYEKQLKAVQEKGIINISFST